MKNKTNISHNIVWWAVKVGCGTLLIAALFARFIWGQEPQLSIPILVGQALVVIGVLIYLWHFRLLKMENPNLGQPQQLTHSKGLYRWVRHPMYLADLITYTGLFLLFISYWSMLVLMLSYLALVRQSTVEDNAMRLTFPHEHNRWSKTSKLLIPLIF